MHCSVEWQHSGVRVCLYSGGTCAARSLLRFQSGPRSGRAGSSLRDVVVQSRELKELRRPRLWLDSVNAKIIS